MNVPQAQGRAGSNSWRRSTGSPPVQTSNTNNNTQQNAYNQAQQYVQLQQQQFLQQQQELYTLQQAQMEMQLQRLRMQNMEMQERFLAASSGQYSAPMTAEPQGIQRRASPMSALHMPTSTPIRSASPSSSPDENTDTRRRNALQNLQRAQQQRSNSGDSEDMGELRQPKRPSRLSFAGGEGLAEKALARKRSGAFSPPATPPVLPDQPATPVFMTHHRKTSSNSSGGSQFAGRKHMSPPSGPTLVLSEPGEKYPSPTSSPQSSDSDSNSEVASFESTTTVASDGLKPMPKTQRAVSDSAIKLNPAASSFNPTASSFTPEPEQRKRHSGIGMNYPSTLDRPQGLRNYTAPPSMSYGAVAFRQPKGPAKEDELESKNFNGRMRKQALKALNRRSFQPPVVEVGA